MKKKFVTLALALVMACSLAIPAGATEVSDVSENIADAPQSICFNAQMKGADGNLGQMELHLNEYQILRKLSEEYEEAKADNTISGSKFAEMSTEEIEAIEDYQEYFSDRVDLLQSWTDKQLQSAGYTEEQIDIVRNFDGSEASMMSLASDCTVKANLVSYSHSSKGSSAKVIAWFNWKGIHSNNFKDIFALVWSSPFKEVSSSGYVKYKDYDTTLTKKINHKPEPEGLYGSCIIFPKYKSVTHEGTYYITGGSMTLTLSSNADVLDFTAYCEYGYTHLNINPGFSVDGSGVGVSISFNSGISTIGKYRVNN